MGVVQQQIKNIRASEFYRHIFVLTSGSAIAQAIPILISPILSRLFTPQEFGILGIYLGIVNILVVLANGRYSVAIMLPEERLNGERLTVLSLYLSFVVSLILFLGVVFFRHPVANLLGAPEILPFLWLVPVSVFLRSGILALEYWRNRNKQFATTAKASVWQQGGTAAPRLLFGVLQYGNAGLIISNVLGGLIGFVSIIYQPAFRHHWLTTFKSHKLKARYLLKRYRKFPLYVMPSNLMNTASLNLPIILLTRYFSTQVAGLYSMAHRMLLLPMSVIGKSFAQVFYQRGAELKSDRKALAAFTYKTYKRLLFVGVVPIALISVFGDYLFSFVFGEEWLLAGVYAQLLSLWVFFNFLSSPLAQLLSIIEKQEKGLIVNFLLLAVRTTPLVVGGILFAGSSLAVVALFAAFSTVFWFAFCFYLLHLVKVPLLPSFMWLLVALIVVYVPMLLLRLQLLDLPFYGF